MRRLFGIFLSKSAKAQNLNTEIQNSCIIGDNLFSEKNPRWDGSTKLNDFLCAANKTNNDLNNYKRSSSQENLVLSVGGAAQTSAVVAAHFPSLPTRIAQILE